MKRLLFAYLLGACAALAAAENASAGNVSTNKASAGVRNPFWPMGYEGERETISPNARPKPKPKDDPAKALPQRPALSRAERERLAAEKAAAEKAAKELAEKAAREKAKRRIFARARFFPMEKRVLREKRVLMGRLCLPQRSPSTRSCSPARSPPATSPSAMARQASGISTRWAA